MDRRAASALLRAGFAVLALAAVVAQLLDDAARGVLDPVNFFSYFTIESNLVGAVAFLATAAWPRQRPLRLELLRGGATVYLTVTLVVYALLLAGPNDAGAPWMNTVLHRVFPIVVILDWAFAPSALPISIRQSLVWLVYPTAWIAYTMVRGLVVGWYPYPFIDPGVGGYASVAAYIVAIFAFGIALCGLVASVSRWRGEARSGAAIGAGV